jgi:DNA-binding transcriptional LysR family regulator
MDRIDSLRLFVRLVEGGSFSAAARALKVKQPTASKSIAALEADVGVTLVQRTTRAVRVTEEGRRFAARAQDVLAAFDDLQTEMAAAAAAPAGHIRVSLPIVFGRRFVLAPLSKFLAEHPQISAEIVLDDRYVNLVEEGFDLAVRVGVPIDTSARGTKILDGRRRLVVAPRYIDTYGKPVAPRDLVRHQCLVHGDPSTPSIWRFRRAEGRSSTVTVRGRVSTNNSEGVLQLARSGIGIGLLAHWLVEADLARGSLVTLLDDFEAPPAPVFALTPPGRYPSGVIRALVEHLKRALADATRRTARAD